MSLSAASLNIALSWAQSRAITGFSPVSTPPQVKSLKITPASSVANRIYNKEISIAASGTTTIDLSSFTDDLGDTITPDKVCTFLVFPSGTGAICKIEPGAANPLTWFFGGTTPSISVPAGGVFGFGQPTGQTVDGTHKNIKLTETGAAAMTVDILLLVHQ